MAESNVARVRSMYDAFARGDVASVLESLDPQIEWLEAENFIYAGGNPYIGRQAVLNGIFMRIGTEWDKFSATPEEIVDGGDTVIALGRYRGTYKATGARVDASFVHVMKFKDGKIARFEQHTDTAQFRDAIRSAAAPATAN
ncbi:MAG: nuclear transport factor 2 family protein [Acidobacteriia bacterium]|nr:nuclear transport factor 2 family protein [Terriglobia bacterium]